MEAPTSSPADVPTSTHSAPEADTMLDNPKQQPQKGTNLTAPKKQRKGPKGGTMKPPKDKDTQSKKNDQPKQPKQKGPKGTKPKVAAPTYQFYYQQLAADLATLASNAQPKDTQALCENVDMKALDSFTRGSTVTQTETITTTTTTTVKQERTLTIRVDQRPETLRSGSGSGSGSDSDASSEITLTPYPNATFQTRRPFRRAARAIDDKQTQHTVITLDNINAVEALEALLERYGGVQHGGILDSNYSFFVNRTRTAAISFIVKDKIAVVGGDPLCEPHLFEAVFAEFKEYRKKHGLGIAIFGGGRDLLEYGKKRGWSSIRFGTERVLNPMNNPVLQEKVQKQVIRQNKQLLDPSKYGLTLGVYNPSVENNPVLQEQLVGVYEAWREAKNASGRPQSYTTIYDPFALPNLMVYIYTKDSEGRPNGFAALRKMGAKKGYYIDPCVAAPGAPRRITDLLYFSAMAMLNSQGCGYLSIGMEPACELEIDGFGSAIEKLARKVHARMFDGLKLGGKAEYYSKFRPDAELDQGMYLMFPKGVPNARQLLATMHFANISIRAVVRKQIDQKLSAHAEAKHGEESKEATATEEAESDSLSNGGASSRPQTAAPAGDKIEPPRSMPRLRSRFSLRSFRSVPDLKAAVKVAA